MRMSELNMPRSELEHLISEYVYIARNKTIFFKKLEGATYEEIAEEYSVNGGKRSKFAYLHGICNKYNCLSIGVPYRMSQDEKQTCINLIMTVKQRYKIKDENIVRQFDVTGEINPEEWYDDSLWNRDIKKKLIDV